MLIHVKFKTDACLQKTKKDQHSSTMKHLSHSALHQTYFNVDWPHYRSVNMYYINQDTLCPGTFVVEQTFPGCQNRRVTTSQQRLKN